MRQEGQAEQAVAALQRMSSPQARLRRDGQQTMVDSQDLVPGDIVLLEAGDIVPADLRLLESVNLQVGEAALTGESVPVDKDADFVADGVLGLADRENSLFSGTAVSYGRAVAVVAATGSATEIGHIAQRLEGIREEATPLQRNLSQLGRILGILCLVVCAIVFAVGLLRGGDPLTMFMTSVSLAVAAIPEGLSVVVTIVLALGMKRLAERHAIVKKLLAVETLGSVDVICSDKTGTLTQNEMTVTRLYAGGRDYAVEGVGYAPEGRVHVDGELVEAPDAELRSLLEIATLCNDAELRCDEEGKYGILGDPTEGALLTVAAKVDVERDALRAIYPQRAERPFDSDRKMMSVAHEGFGEHDELRSLTKGAPDIILARCVAERTAGGELRPLDEARRAEIEAVNLDYASQALRVLAFAYRVHDGQEGWEDEIEEEMVFVGLMGLIDPARPEAQAAIADCQAAGIRPVMITGDYRETALAIAAELGLLCEGDEALSGDELEAMSDEELRQRVERTAVYARVSPEHKVRIVAALREEGHICSMTGDGVNDAPALKQADIGVAMGITGTEVAKSTADMILTDDNFATIVSAVSEGRSIFSNIRKFTAFLLSCNVGEILVIFLTTLILGPLFAPLSPIQLLWLNLVTDSFPALALGREAPEDDIMRRPPRPRGEHIINRDMIMQIATQALAIFIAVFVAFTIGRMRYPDQPVTNEGSQVVAAQSVAAEEGKGFAEMENFRFIPESGHRASRGAETFAFATLILAELLRAYSCRSERRSVFRQGLFSNRASCARPASRWSSSAGALRAAPGLHLPDRAAAPRRLARHRAAGGPALYRRRGL